MVRTVETSVEDNKKLLDEGGNAKATIKQKERTLKEFREWVTKKGDHDWENLIATSKTNEDSKKTLEDLSINYLNSIRVLDKDTNTLERPKVN